MPQITLDHGDAAELAETLTFITDWLSGSQQQALEESLAAFVGHPAYNTQALRSDLHRFVFLLGASDGEETLQRANAMTANISAARPLDRITHITPSMRWPVTKGMDCAWRPDAPDLCVLSPGDLLTG
jgi:hypothetical protein